MRLMNYNNKISAVFIEILRLLAREMVRSMYTGYRGVTAAACSMQFIVIDGVNLEPRVFPCHHISIRCAKPLPISGGYRGCHIR